jgi:hypothetical protein
MYICDFIAFAVECWMIIPEGQPNILSARIIQKDIGMKFFGTSALLGLFE